MYCVSYKFWVVVLSWNEEVLGHLDGGHGLPGILQTY